jgi:hypothetical protein
MSAALLYFFSNPFRRNFQHLLHFFKQADTGIIVTAVLSSAVLLSIINSKLSDLFFGQLKSIICCFLTLGSAFSAWLALLALSVVPPSKSAIYISAIGAMVAPRCILGPFYELLMELSYPAQESIVSVVWNQVISSCLQ